MVIPRLKNIKIVKDIVEINSKETVWDKIADSVHFFNGKLTVTPFYLAGIHPIKRLQGKTLTSFLFLADASTNSSPDIVAPGGFKGISLSSPMPPGGGGGGGYFSIPVNEITQQ
jgi:hypothetical protein